MRRLAYRVLRVEREQPEPQPPGIERELAAWETIIAQYGPGVFRPSAPEW